MIVVTNPRATPRAIFRGPGDDVNSYKIEKPDGTVVELAKKRIAKANKAAADFRAAGQAGDEPEVEEPNN